MLQLDTIPGRVSIGSLGSVLLGGYAQDALGVHSGGQALTKPLLLFPCQIRRAGDVEEYRYPGLDLVDVLTPGAGTAGGAVRDLALGKREVLIDVEHRDGLSRGQISSCRAPCWPVSSATIFIEP